MDNKENPIAKIIGKQIKTIRQSKGMTISEFAALANKDRTYISKLENGSLSSTVDNLQLFLDALNCKIGIIDKTTGEVPSCITGQENTGDKIRKEIAMQMATSICNLAGLKIEIKES